MERILIFTGKGGVGKTSVATAHAFKSADEGKKTILISTDMAHNLGDILDISLGKEPVEAAENLDVYEIDPEHVMQEDYPDIMEAVFRMLPRGAGEENGSASADFGMFPGMEELFALLKIEEMWKSGRYDRIIVDCAPTGETLSLLKFPELLSWYMEKLFPIGKFAVPLLAPISKKLFSVELPGKAAMSDIERLYSRLFGLQQLLKNRETTSIRLVAVPEKMVVEETMRSYMYLNLYDFNVDGLYINRILPEAVDNPFFLGWKKIQQCYMKQLEEAFSQLAIYRIPWYEEEIRGREAVLRICEDVLKDDIFEAKAVTQRESYEKNEEGYVLRMYIPYAGKEELELYQSTGNVVIRLGNFKRNIPLPDVLRSYKIASAKLDEGNLRIQFQKETRGHDVKA